MSTAESRIKELNLTLPFVPKPVGKYKPAVIVGNLLYVSGHGPTKGEVGSTIHGKVGGDLTLEQGQETARLVGLNMLATVRDTLGSLDKVKRVIKTLGLVNATPNFAQHPQVVNGFSDLMAQVFGDDAGVGARSAVGVASLPGNIAVEVECIFEIG